MSTKTSANLQVQSKSWKHYKPKRAYADSCNPLSLAVSATTVKDLEFLTRGVWTRASHLKLYHGTAEDVGRHRRDPLFIDLDGIDCQSLDDQEIVSAIIKTCRITRSSSLNAKCQRPSGDETSSATTDAPSTESLEATEDGIILEDDESDSTSESEKSLAIDGLPVDEGDDGSNPDTIVPGLSMECPSLEAWEKRKELFSNFDEGCIIDKTAWYEITPEAHALAIARKIGRAMKAPVYDYKLSAASSSKGGSTPDGERKVKRARVDKTLPNRVINDAGQDVVKEGEGLDEEGKKGKEERLQPTLLAEVTRKTRPVLAAACGVGGEAIALARCLDQCEVVAVDIDADKINRCCAQNAAVYGVKDRIKFVHEDINTYAKEKEREVIDVIRERTVQLPPIESGNTMEIEEKVVEEVRKQRPFGWCTMSPPWGGPEYRAEYCYNMSVQTFTDLIRMIQSCMRIADNLCLILPRNQDVDEIIHLACHGVPDGERFIHVEFDRMSDREDGYPKILAVYLCRDTSLLLSEPDLSRKAEFMSARLKGKLGSIKSGKAPKVSELREELPELDVSFRMLEKKRGATPRLHLEDMFNVVLCRFLLGYLGEPPFQIRFVEAWLNLIGVANFLTVVGETMRTVRSGGMKQRRNKNQSRSKGGQFFEILHQSHPVEFKILRKWRNRFMEALRERSSSSHQSRSDDPLQVQVQTNPE